MTLLRTGTASTISTRFWVDEEAITVATPTVRVVDDSGAVVVASTTPSGPDADNYYNFLLPSAALASVTTLTATWSGDYSGTSITTTEVIEVAGGHYFELGELRALADLPQRSYSTLQLARAREWITDIIDGEVFTSFVERSHHDVRTCGVRNSSRGAAVRPLRPYPRSVRWLKVDGVTVSAGDVEFLDGDLVAKVGAANPFAGSWSTVDIGYTAGYRTSCPTDLADAAMVAARWHLIAKDGQSGIPDRATSISNEFGNISLSTPGLRGAIVGLPEVDERIREWARRVRIPGIA